MPHSLRVIKNNSSRLFHVAAIKSYFNSNLFRRRMTRRNATCLRLMCDHHHHHRRDRVHGRFCKKKIWKLPEAHQILFCSTVNLIHKISFFRFFYRLESLKCHSECIGGCVNATSSGCNVCRNFKNEGACVDQCPKDKFLYMSRKECVDGAFCKSRGLIPFQRECRRECPAKYTREDPKTKIVSNTTCYECSSVTCMKRCQPSVSVV